MKTIIPLLFFLSAASAGHAAIPSGSGANQSVASYTARTINVPGTGYDVSFSVTWNCDDFPQISAPGLIQLIDANGQQVAEVAASLYSDGPAYTTSGPGTVTDLNSWVAVYTSGGEVADGSLSATWHLTGLTPGTYTLRLWRYTTWSLQYLATTVWTNTSFVSGSVPAPTNSSPSVALLAPGDQTVTAGTTLTITSHATDLDGNITGHNLDIQRPAGDWNFQGGFATGEPYQGGPVGSGADSTRMASFTFTDVGTYYVRSAADDGSGWVHSATVAITVVAAPPAQYALVTSAGAGGMVSPGGTYSAGTVVYISATPDGTHDFAGWSGDAGGAGNPLSLGMDANKAVQANFSPKLFALTTSATTGGSVTPGGSYPSGTSVTVSAAPDASHTFIGWAGDASGTAPSISLTVTGPLNVQAVFSNKAAQSIIFPTPGNQPVGSFALGGSASSGLPVTYTVLSGPATIIGNQIQVTGPGAVTVQASQAGDATYLPAPSVNRTFNAVAAAFLKYRPAGRTLLQDSVALGASPFVLENP